MAKKPIQAHIDVKIIHTDSDNTNKSPKASDDTGIFNKISSIWTKRNENTASDTSHKQQNNKNQSDSIVKHFKKLFKN